VSETCNPSSPYGAALSSPYLKVGAFSADYSVKGLALDEQLHPARDTPRYNPRVISHSRPLEHLVLPQMHHMSLREKK